MSDEEREGDDALNVVVIVGRVVVLVMRLCDRFEMSDERGASRSCSGRHAERRERAGARL